MKKIFKSIVGALLVSALMVGTIAATDVIAPRLGDPVDPMGSCYFEVTLDGTASCVERWYGTVLESREFFPSVLEDYTATKHGETHRGNLSMSSCSIGEFQYSENDGGYTNKHYKATVTYSGYLSCNGDISEMRVIIND